MWFPKQGRFLPIIYSRPSRSVLVLLLLISALFAGCQEKPKKEQKKASEAKGKNRWEPLEVQEEEQKEAENAVKDIEQAYYRFLTEKKKTLSEKEQEQLSASLETKKRTVSDVNAVLTVEGSRRAKAFCELWENNGDGELELVKLNSSGGFSLMTLKRCKDMGVGVLTTVVLEESGALSVSEMVKYKIKDVWTEKDRFCFEFYLSDQAELQSDGTMRFRFAEE